MPTMNDRTFRALRVILDDHFSKEPVGVERLSEAYGMVDLWWDEAQPIADRIAPEREFSRRGEALIRQHGGADAGTVRKNSLNKYPEVTPGVFHQERK